MAAILIHYDTTVIMLIYEYIFSFSHIRQKEFSLFSYVYAHKKSLLFKPLVSTLPYRFLCICQEHMLSTDKKC